MNSLIPWITAVLALAYGGLTTITGLGQSRQKKIQVWAAWGMVLFGLVVAGSGVLLLLKAGSALLVLAIGLVAIHLLAINNGLEMFGKINPGHHLIRLLVSLTLLALTYLGMS